MSTAKRARTDDAGPAAVSGSGSGSDSDELQYIAGFGNDNSTEALPGALPARGNNPQKCPYNLYAEYLSGTAFTQPRKDNQRTWLYRTRPSVVHEPFRKLDTQGRIRGCFHGPGAHTNPNQLRWLPMPMPGATTDGAAAVDFVDGLVTMGGSGDPAQLHGLAVHMYACNASMVDRALQVADGDMLIVPQEGALRITTEMGIMHVAPREICVVQRGIR